MESEEEACECIGQLAVALYRHRIKLCFPTLQKYCMTGTLTPLPMLLPDKMLQTSLE